MVVVSLLVSIQNRDEECHILIRHISFAIRNKFLVELTKYVLHLILHQVVLGGQMGKKTIGKLIGEDKQLYEVKRTQKNSQSRVCHEEHLVLIELVAYLPKIILG